MNGLKHYLRILIALPVLCILQMNSSAEYCPAPCITKRQNEKFDEKVDFNNFLTTHRIDYFESISKYEPRNLKLREEAMALFERHPDKPKEWLPSYFNALSAIVYYCKDIRAVADRVQVSNDPFAYDMDKEAKARWDTVSRQMFKSAWQSPDVSDKKRFYIHQAYILRAWFDAFYTACGDKPFDFEEYKTRIRDCQRFDKSAGELVSLANTVFFYPERLKVTKSQLKAFSNELTKFDTPELRELGFAKKRLLSHAEHPMDIKGKTIDGKKFDLSSCRGKIVLVHFWPYT